MGSSTMRLGKRDGTGGDFSSSLRLGKRDDGGDFSSSLRLGKRYLTEDSLAMAKLHPSQSIDPYQQGPTTNHRFGKRTYSLPDGVNSSESEFESLHDLMQQLSSYLDSLSSSSPTSDENNMSPPMLTEQLDSI